MQAQEEFDSLTEWVQDPGSTRGRMTACDRMLATFWVTKGMLGRVLMERSAKDEGDTEPVRAWKEHNSDCRLMHRKVDVIGSKLGIKFLPHPELTPTQPAQPVFMVDGIVEGMHRQAQHALGIAAANR